MYSTTIEKSKGTIIHRKNILHASHENSHSVFFQALPVLPRLQNLKYTRATGLLSTGEVQYDACYMNSRFQRKMFSKADASCGWAPDSGNRGPLIKDQIDDSTSIQKNSRQRMIGIQNWETRLEGAQCAVICWWMAVHADKSVVQTLRYEKSTEVKSP